MPVLLKLRLPLFDGFWQCQTLDTGFSCTQAREEAITKAREFANSRRGSNSRTNMQAVFNPMPIILNGSAFEAMKEMTRRPNSKMRAATGLTNLLTSF